MQTRSNKLKRCVIITAVTYQTLIPPSGIPCFCIILLTHGQEQVPDVIPTEQPSAESFQSMHKYRCSSPSIDSWLHLLSEQSTCPFWYSLFVNFLKPYISFQHFPPEQCREFPCFSVSLALYPRERHVSPSRRGKAMRLFPPSGPLGILDRDTRSLLLGYLGQHQGRSPAELQKQGLRKVTPVLGLMECPHLFSLQISPFME